LKNNTSTSNNPDELALVLVEEQTNDDLEEENIDINMDDNNVSDSEHTFNSSPTQPANVDAEPISVDIYDPAN
jgi:hypothetical protein